MDAWTPANLNRLSPLEADRLPDTLTDIGLARSRRVGLESFAADCLTLGADLERAFEPLHRLGEELLDRLAPPTTSSARMV